MMTHAYEGALARIGACVNAGADDVADRGAGGLGELVGGDVVAGAEEVAELDDVGGRVELVGAGAQEAVDDEPDHGHRAEGDRVHDPAAFMEQVHEGLFLVAGGGRFGHT